LARKQNDTHGALLITTPIAMYVKNIPIWSETEGLSLNIHNLSTCNSSQCIVGRGGSFVEKKKSGNFSLTIYTTGPAARLLSGQWHYGWGFQLWCRFLVPSSKNTALIFVDIFLIIIYCFIAFYYCLTLLFIILKSLSNTCTQQLFLLYRHFNHLWVMERLLMAFCCWNKIWNCRWFKQVMKRI